MAKIHTHYDNLKVSRMAPQEVIRAAYKALSQKYHPDKNPGDEKAARIMAILNSAYGTLSDPTRRREHDEWIAAEEWEIEWLESTRNEDTRDRPRLDDQHWQPEETQAPAPYRISRDPNWWFSLGLCLALGCVGGILLMNQAKVMPAGLASVLGVRTEAKAAPPAPAPERRPDPLLDSWAVAKAHVPDPGRQAPEIKALAVTQLVIPARSPDCDTELRSLIAPNGEPWPQESGYVDGFPLGNQGEDMQISVDNTRNSSPVLVKVYDLDRRSNVRHVYLLPNESIVVDRLAAGKYEVRYQNIDVGGSQDDCLARKRRPLKQAAVQPEVVAP